MRRCSSSIHRSFPFCFHLKSIRITWATCYTQPTVSPIIEAAILCSCVIFSKMPARRNRSSCCFLVYNKRKLMNGIVNSSYPSRCQILLPGTLHVPFLTCIALHVLRSQLLGHHHRLFDTGFRSSAPFIGQVAMAGLDAIICWPIREGLQICVRAWIARAVNLMINLED